MTSSIRSTELAAGTRKVPSSVPYYDEEDTQKVLEDIRQILKSKRLVLGPFTRKYEELFANYVGTKYAVAVSSATAALEIVLRYFDVREKEIIVPCNTFIACPNTVLYAGGKPVFSDMNPESFCLDIEDVKEKITEKTKAIMIVHLAGLPEPEMEALRDLSHDHELFLMEDCSHAHGATFDGKKVGALSEAGCFSLFATKIMAIGTGGMITTDNKELADYAEALRHQGGIGGEGQIEVFDKFGYDWMMSEVTAALGISQLARLDEQIERRRRVAQTYMDKIQKLGDNSMVRLPPEQSRSNSVYWKYITLLEDQVNRDGIRATMRKQFTIDAGILYPTLCHLQPVYQALGYTSGNCPKAEDVMKHQLTLPVNPYMTEADVTYVVESLSDTLVTSNSS